MLDQKRAPIFEALCHYIQSVKAPFHVPGHKMGRGAAVEWQRFLGETALSIDLTEAPGLDDLHAPEGPIAEAQVLAAQAFGAHRSFFLVGGSTAGLHALILAACHPESVIAIPRNAHRSILGAMILAGLQPAWVRVQFHEDLDIATGLEYSSLRSSLKSAKAAVFIHPTYYGLTGDLATFIQEAHEHDIPALVDEAHGSHFKFHPAFPPSALSLGADGTVQSTHKTGGSLTQSSLCHLGQNHRLSEARVQEMLRLVQSTSPSYLLMSSLDTARRDLALHGREMWDRALELSYTARHRLGSLRGIRVPPANDPTKILIDVRGRGLTGFQASEFLWSRGIAVESSGMSYVLAVVTPADTRQTVEHLVVAVESLPSGPGVPPNPPHPPWPEVVVNPRHAYLGPKRPVTLAKAVGRIAAELVAPYPPGIPAVAPGERLTSDVVAYLHHAVDAGYHLQGPADSRLTTIQVMEE